MALLLAPVAAWCQEEQQAAAFQIYRNKEVIGSVVAVSLKDGAKQAYRIETHVNVKVVFSFKADISVRNSFVDGVMVYGEAKRVFNNALKLNNRITRSGNGYQIVDKNQDTTFHEGAIKYCVSQLFFIEPVNQKSVFSEAFAQALPLKKLDGNTYELRLPDGHINHYHYEKGVCKEVYIETQLSNVNLVRISGEQKN